METHPSIPDNLAQLLRQAAEHLPEKFSHNPGKKQELQDAALDILEAHGNPMTAALSLLPDGHQIIPISDNNDSLQPLIRESEVDGSGRPEPGAENEYIPRHLEPRAKIEKTVVYETLLWAHGTLSNM